MELTVEAQLKKFTSFQNKDCFQGLKFESRDPYSFVLAPKTPFQGDKPIGLTLLAIVHGNEVAGLAVLNHILELIDQGIVRLSLPVAFALGNKDAALLNKRFVEKDLNRSFACSAGESLEHRRARFLETILEQTCYLVDFHQTLRTSLNAFFIFPYNKNSFEFARLIRPYQPIVTHWGKPFSQEGRCSDEFVNSKGGVGITVELGKIGFDAYQIDTGIAIGLKALQIVQGLLKDGCNQATHPQGPVYTWADIMDWPEKGLVELRQDLVNFLDVKAGDVLGVVDDTEIKATVPGKILFPKFLSKEEQTQLKYRPKELCRILRPVLPDELAML